MADWLVGSAATVGCCLAAAKEGALALIGGALIGDFDPLANCFVASVSALASRTGATNCGWGRASLSCT